MPLHKAGDDSSFAESELCSRSWSPGEELQEEVNRLRSV